jgi:putative hydrolase of the HAD superfamily
MKVFIFDLDDTIIYHQFGQVNYDNMRIDSTLTNLLENLKYPKIIYTNGTLGHADEVLKQMRLTNMFDAIYARDTMPAMKPLMESFSFVEKDIRKNIDEKNKYYFFDDRLENLHTAKTRGWTTIWVHTDFMNKSYYVDYAFPNIHTAIMYFLID